MEFGCYIVDISYCWLTLCAITTHPAFCCCQTRHHVLRPPKGTVSDRRYHLGDTIQSNDVGHDYGRSVQLGFQIAERVIFQFPPAILLECSGTIKCSCGGYARVVRCESVLNLDPVPRLHISPEGTFQPLA